MAEEQQEIAGEEKIELVTLDLFGPSLEFNETAAVPLVNVPSSPAKDAAKDLNNHNEDLVSVDLSLAISRNPNLYFKGSCAGINKEGVRKNKKRSLPKEEREEEVLITGPWTIAKKLCASDVGTNSPLTVRKEDVESHVNIHFSADAQRKIQEASRVELKVYDHESKSEHMLMFMRHVFSSKSYVLNGDWAREFVKRRRLKEGDTIGLFWGADSRLHFSVRMRHFR